MLKKKEKVKVISKTLRKVLKEREVRVILSAHFHH